MGMSDAFTAFVPDRRSRCPRRRPASAHGRCGRRNPGHRSPSEVATLTVTSVSNSASGPDQRRTGTASHPGHRRRLAPAWRVTAANGRPVTTAFRMQPDGTALGLVTGLRQGRNEIAVSSGQERARLTLDDHPISGPVFSGKQQQPFYCETTAYGLAPAVQPLCSAPTIVSYQYRTTAGAFVALPDPSARPADLAVAEVNGHPVPYIVRVETGTIDRAVYQTAPVRWRHRPRTGRSVSERQTGLYVRGRLQRRLPPGKCHRRCAERFVPLAGLRSGFLQPQCARQQLQHHHFRRSGDDGQGTLHRHLRSWCCTRSAGAIRRPLSSSTTSRTPTRASSTASFRGCRSRIR